MTGSIGWDGEHVYSYGYHYPLLIALETAGGTRWILNDRGYSSTTGRHIHWARSFSDAAVSIDREIYRPTYPEGVKAAAVKEIADMERDIKLEEEKQQDRPRYASSYQKNIDRFLSRIENLNKVIRIAEDAAVFASSKDQSHA